MVIFEKKVCFCGMPEKKVCFAGNLLATHKYPMATPLATGSTKLQVHG